MPLLLQLSEVDADIQQNIVTSEIINTVYFRNPIIFLQNYQNLAKLNQNKAKLSQILAKTQSSATGVVLNCGTMANKQPWNKWPFNFPQKFLCLV